MQKKHRSELDQLRDWQHRAAAKLREITDDMNPAESRDTGGWWGEVLQLLEEVDQAQADPWQWSWMATRWNEMVDRLGDQAGPRRMVSWTEDRKRHARARIEGDTRAAWEAACTLLERSPFLSRKCREAGTWRPDVDWMLTPGGWAKLHEGKYSEAREVRDPEAGESAMDARRTSAAAGQQHAERMARYGKAGQHGRVPRSELLGRTAPAAPAQRRVRYEDGPCEGDE